MKRSTCLFVFLLLAANLAFAQAPPTVSTEIVVTASAVPETIETTPASLTVITKKEIEDRAARDVAEALREVPGLTVSRTGSLGKSTSVFIRGASSKQTLVLFNGVEINDVYFSGYNWGQFSTAGVERVEVARGPFSSLYGADAVGGVVNIITTGGGNQMAGDLAGGGRGLRDASISMSRADGSFSTFATVEHRQDDGFAPNDNDRQNALVAGINHAGASFTAGLNGRFVNYDLGVPRNTNLFATAYVPTLFHRERGREWQLAVPLTARAGSVLLEGRVSESRRSDEIQDPEFESFGETDAARRNARAAARMATSFGTIVAGGEVERAESTHHDSFGLDIDKRSRSSNALFIEDRYERIIGAGRIDVSAGFRRDHFSTFGTETSPRIAAAWSSGGNKIRGAYGQSFRAPQIGELYLPFFGNPDLKAERSRSSEVGYDHYFAEGSVSITAFNNDFHELIVYDVFQNRFGNIGEARSRGVELSAGRRSGPLSTRVMYTYLQATEEPSGDLLVRRPKHSVSVALGWDGPRFGADLVVVGVGSRRDINDLFPFDTVTNERYSTADLTVRWNAGQFTPYVKVENATNTEYEEVFGYPSPDRRVIAGLRVRSGR